MASQSYVHKEFLEIYPRSKTPKQNVRDKIRDLTSWRPTKSCITEWLKRRIPILDWLPRYKPKEDLLPDVMAGLSVGIFHIPQGMAFAMLALLPPYHGIYMGFFPVIVYALLGTSPHMSTGTFAVVLLMSSTVVDKYRTDIGQNNTLLDDNPEVYGPVEVNAAVALMVGLWQIVLGLLQLGGLTVFLSDTLVSGFTCGAAFHVLTSQVPNLFGISIPRSSGPLKIIFSWIDIFKHIVEANVAAIIVAACAITILVVYNELIKPHWAKRIPCPLPIELLVVIMATVVSYFMDLHQEYDVKIAGYIPKGIPGPKAPPADLLPKVLKDSLVIAIVAYTINYSVSKLFANQKGYEIDATQEFYAHGASNVVGGFFLCGPSAVALARALVQLQSGAKTQLTGLVTALVLMIVLLALAPYFKTLPSPVLSSVVVVSLKSMLLQVFDFKRAIDQSAMDAFVWAMAFFGVVILDIDYGLVLAIFSVIVAILYRSQNPKTGLLGVLPGTQLYVNTSMYDKAEEIPGVKIFQFSGGLHFANRHHYKDELLRLTREWLKEGEQGDDIKVAYQRRFLILDCSLISFVDSSGSKTICQMVETFRKANVEVILVLGTGHVAEKLESLETVDFSEKAGAEICPTVNNAVSLVLQRSPTVED